MDGIESATPYRYQGDGPTSCDRSHCACQPVALVIVAVSDRCGYCLSHYYLASVADVDARLQWFALRHLNSLQRVGSVVDVDASCLHLNGGYSVGFCFLIEHGEQVFG